MLNKKQIQELPREQIYQRYKEKKRTCRTIAQEVEMSTTDPEMILIIERLKSEIYIIEVRKK